ncbi:auxin-induced protein 6B [Senna tora]|uniref:Auxin-induced protein 6B n=1 Tax=Senna tora TaxID=362788 RepID=A0A834T9M5_9FABA|nr:auxin-induced protein 6B [Senna tora]
MEGSFGARGEVKKLVASDNADIWRKTYAASYRSHNAKLILIMILNLLYMEALTCRCTDGTVWYSREGFGKCCKLRCIVRVCQMLRRWRNKARMSPSDVPSGHVAVCVGSRSRRYVVKATYLNHPFFWKLLNGAEEEYGFCNNGPLTIPCDEALFEEVLCRVSSSSTSPNQKHAQKNCHLHLWQDCRPLLQATPY